MAKCSTVKIKLHKLLTTGQERVKLIKVVSVYD